MPDRILARAPDPPGGAVSSTDPAATCGSCRYFYDDAECRRYPPRPMWIAERVDDRLPQAVFAPGIWPETHRDEWCGEWARYDGPEEEDPRNAD